MLKPGNIVKVCGVTSREDAQAAIDAGANAIGFNFYHESPRYVTFQQAAEIIDKLHGDFLRVGVFVNPKFLAVDSNEVQLDVAQIHGSGSVSLPTWRAVSAGTIPMSDASVDAWLLDTFTPQFGGSGKTFDWCLAAKFPYRAIIAGGLDASNVADAIKVAHPYGVDSCSRLESSPGKKDHARVSAFVRSAFAALNAQQVLQV